MSPQARWKLWGFKNDGGKLARRRRNFFLPFSSYLHFGNVFSVKGFESNRGLNPQIFKMGLVYISIYTLVQMRNY